MWRNRGQGGSLVPPNTRGNGSHSLTLSLSLSIALSRSLDLSRALSLSLALFSMWRMTWRALSGRP